MNESHQRPVGYVSQDFLDGKWTLDHIAKSDEGQISRTIPVFTRAQLGTVPEYNGWYCAQCERGVDPSEVTFNEAHTECGRIITNDRPPAPQPAEVGADDAYSLAHEIWATAQLGPHDSIADAVDRIAALLARAQLTAAGGRGDLVQALAELCDEIEKHSIHTLISATNITWFKRKAREALAATQPAKESKSCE